MLADFPVVQQGLPDSRTIAGSLMQWNLVARNNAVFSCRNRDRRTRYMIRQPISMCRTTHAVHTFGLVNTVFFLLALTTFCSNNIYTDNESQSNHFSINAEYSPWPWIVLTTRTNSINTELVSILLRTLKFLIEQLKPTP